MDEYIRVVFPDDRTVFIDGVKSGRTNKRLIVERGTHTIHLGEPRNYEPAWRRPKVAGTSVSKPLEVAFEKV